MAQGFKRNAAKFAAYKTLQQTQLLANSKAEDLEAIDKAYNTNYLRAEKNFATRSARMADNWMDYEADKDIYPYLEYTVSLSADKRESHLALIGTIKPINDPFWSEWYPPNGWGCKCGVKQRDSQKGSKTPDMKNVPLPPEAMRNNPAKTGLIFTDKNPTIAAMRKVHKPKNNPELYNELLKYEAAGFAGRKVKDITLWKRYGQGAVVEFGEQTHGSDYQRLNLAARSLAEQGHIVEITPRTHFKDPEYAKVYGGLINSRYHRKCPDFKVDGLFYEHEGFQTKSDKSLRNMLSRGAKQAERLIIDDHGDKDWYYKKRLLDYNRQSNKKINELWILRENGELHLIK